MSILVPLRLPVVSVVCQLLFSSTFGWMEGLNLTRDCISCISIGAEESSAVSAGVVDGLGVNCSVEGCVE